MSSSQIECAEEVAHDFDGRAFCEACGADEASSFAAAPCSGFAPAGPVVAVNDALRRARCAIEESTGRRDAPGVDNRDRPDWRWG